MPQYAMLLYSPAPADPDEMPEDELEAQGRYGNQIEEMGGKISYPMALQSSAMATSIRADLVTDGPFIESKEVLAGIFVLEARDLDHALQIAKQCPSTWRGGVELRPIFALGE